MALTCWVSRHGDLSERAKWIQLDQGWLGLHR